jgi:Fe-S-cluster-containing dehydrogenase component
MSVNRRDFLKIAGAAGVASIAGSSAAGSEAVNRVSDDWMGMLTDLTLCVGCRKCEWACRQANGPADSQPIDAYDDKSVFEKKRRTDDISLTVLNRYDSPRAGEKPVYVKTQCMHCFEPACASACPAKAYRKTPEGPVVYDASICIGCRYCMVACPFEMPAYTYDNPLGPVIRKCQMCFERITRKDEAPACAAMCPVEAITFGKRSHLVALARRKIEHEPGKYVNHIYGEHEAGGTNWLYIAGRPFEELGFRTNIGPRPYPELTKGFLSTLPFVQTIWPALLVGAYTFARRREEVGAARSDQRPAQPAVSEGETR